MKRLFERPQRTLSLNEELRRSLRFAAGGFVALLGLSLGAGLVLIMHTEPQTRYSIDYARSMRSFHQGMVEQESALTGYLSTGSNDFLSRYNAGRDLANSERNRIAKYQKSAPTSVRHQSEQVVNAGVAWQKWADNQVNRRASDSTAKSVIDVTTADEDRILFETYRSSQLDLLNSLNVYRDKTLKTFHWQLVTTVVVECLSAMLFMLLARVEYMRLAKSIVRPINDAVFTMKSIENGDWDVRPNIDGPAELRDVNRGLSEMISALVAEREISEQRLHENEMRATGLAELLAMSQAINAGNTVAEVSAEIARSSMSASSFEGVTIWMAESSEDSAEAKLTPVAHLSERAKHLGPTRFPEIEDDSLALMRDAPPLRSVQSGVTQLAGDGDGVLVPMMLGSELIGIIDLRSKESMTVTDVQLGSLESLAIHGAASLGRARLNEQVNLLLESSGDGIIGIDRSGRCIFANAAVTRILGYKPEELTGLHVHDIIHHTLENGEKCNPENCSTALTLIDAKPRHVVDDVMWHSDGHAVPVDWIAQAMVLHGSIEGVVVTINDVTDRHCMQAELRSALDSAMEASRLKSEFLANMSHEIRTPLNGVIGMTEFLLDTDLSQRQRDFVLTARNSGQALLGIINDILDISKIEAGKLDIEEVEFDVSAIVDEVGSLFATRAHEKSLELAVSVDPNVPRFLRGDPVRIRQVLTNLVANAVKFTHQGEVSVSVRTRCDSGDQITLQFDVNDSGIGLLDDQRKRLFENFSQADSSTTRKYGGTGLGLAICRQLVELMHGDIGLDSEYGAGSRFWFTIELQKTLRSSELGIQPLVLQNQINALVVDDNETCRRFMLRDLVAYGISGRSARSATDALHILRTAQEAGELVDLMVVDALMPNVDGYALAELVAQDKMLVTPKIIMLQSTTDVRDISDDARHCVVATITKPVRRTALTNALQLVTDQARQDRQDRADQTQNAHSTGVISLTDSRISKPSDSAKVFAANSGGRKNILVVDDNDTNQRVTELMVEKLGFCCQVASGGTQALRFLERFQFDLVLMDCQMPEMDGYETARRIREREATVGMSNIPIVAMTASVIAGEREKCIAAGMNAYLPKPFSVEQLGSCIEGQLSRGPLPEESIESESSNSSQSNTLHELIQVSRLDSIVALARDDQGNEMVTELITGFVRGTRERIDELQVAIQQNDATAAARVAHGVKGSAGTFGALALSNKAREIEQAIQNADLEAAISLTDELDETLDETCNALVRAFEN